MRNGHTPANYLFTGVADSGPNALTYLTKLMELKAALINTRPEDLQLQQQAAANLLNAPAAAEASASPAMEPTRTAAGHAPSVAAQRTQAGSLLYAADLLTESKQITSCMEDVWQEIMSVGTQMLQHSELCSTQSSATSSRSYSVNQHCTATDHAHLLTCVYNKCNIIGSALVELQSRIDKSTQRFANAALQHDWGVSQGKPLPQPDELQDAYQHLVQECLTSGLSVDTLFLSLSDLHTYARKMMERIIKQAATPPTDNSRMYLDAETLPQSSPSAESGSNRPAADAQWKPPDQFRRSTSKFWVRLEDVPRLRVAILRHLPLLVLGREEGALITYLKHAQQQKDDDLKGQDPQDEQKRQLPLSFKELSSRSTDNSASSAISSVYFDAPGATDQPPQPPQPPGACHPAHPGQDYVHVQQHVRQKPDRLQLWPFAAHISPQESVMKAPMPVYHSRLRRDDGASLVRLRWYGPYPDPAVGHVFVERKLHRDAWTGEFSLKERARIPVAHLPGFLAGFPLDKLSSLDESAPTPTPAHPSPVPSVIKPNQLMGASSTSTASPSISDANHQQLLTEIQTFLTKHKQVAVLRTSYHRAAFQRSDTNAVRISLDTQVTMSVEHPGPTRPWTVASTNLPHGQRTTVRFPFAIIEIKLLDGDSCPDWVLAARQSGVLVEVPKFSKYLHGISLLYPSLVRHTPPWFIPKRIPSSITPHDPCPQHLDTPTACMFAQADGSMALVTRTQTLNSHRPIDTEDGTSSSSAADSPTSMPATSVHRLPTAFSEPPHSSSSRVGGTAVHTRSISAAHILSGASRGVPPARSMSPLNPQPMNLATTSGITAVVSSTAGDAEDDGNACHVRCWAGVVQAVMCGQSTDCDGDADTSLIMMPATIEEVQECWDEEDMPFCLFSEDVSPEQWFDARGPSYLSHPHTYLGGGPSCPACSHAVSATAPCTKHRDSPYCTAACAAPNSGPCDPPPMHTCTLGKVCQAAHAWALPAAPSTAPPHTVIAAAREPSSAACVGGVDLTGLPTTGSVEVVGLHLDASKPIQSPMGGGDVPILDEMIGVVGDAASVTPSRVTLPGVTCAADHVEITLCPLSCAADSACSTPTLIRSASENLARSCLSTSSSAGPSSNGQRTPPGKPHVWVPGWNTRSHSSAVMATAPELVVNSKHSREEDEEDCPCVKVSSHGLPQRLTAAIRSWQRRLWCVMGGYGDEDEEGPWKPGPYALPGPVSAVPGRHALASAVPVSRPLAAAAPTGMPLGVKGGMQAIADRPGLVATAAAAAMISQPAVDLLRVQSAPQTALLDASTPMTNSTSDTSITTMLTNCNSPASAVTVSGAKGEPLATAAVTPKHAEELSVNGDKGGDGNGVRPGSSDGSSGYETWSVNSEESSDASHDKVVVAIDQGGAGIRVLGPLERGVGPWRPAGVEQGKQAKGKNADVNRSQVAGVTRKGSDGKVGARPIRLAGWTRSRGVGGASWHWLMDRIRRGVRRVGIGRHVGSVDEESGLYPRASPLVRSRIEPKTFFAAERTFLSWLNLAVLLVFVALSLLANANSFATRENRATPVPAPAPPSTLATPHVTAAQGPVDLGFNSKASEHLHLQAVPGAGSLGAGGPDDGAIMVTGGSAGLVGLTSTNVSRQAGGGLLSVCGSAGALCQAGMVSGLSIAPLALLLMCYALWTYRKRTAQILRRETARYDDQRGPIILVVLLVGLLVVAIALAVRNVLT